VTGRDRTCDAPRFRRALYRLSYGHANGADVNRLIEKARARVRETVADRLEPGEEVELLFLAVTRPSFLMDVLISPLLAMLQRSWYVVLTDRRILLVPLARASGRPTGIEWDEPRAGVGVERYRPGLLMGKLFLRRATDGRVLKLRFLFRYRNDAIAIKDALGG
jgi:hypothetical protein